MISIVANHLFIAGACRGTSHCLSLSYLTFSKCDNKAMKYTQLTGNELINVGKSQFTVKILV